ncbi:MAG: acyl--CoA ligase [Holophagales bacterium]|nr:MAG: acyl--CoA ligase [Holophagales bacterium]
MTSDPILRDFAALLAAEPRRPLVASPRRRATVADVDLAAGLLAGLVGRRELGEGRLVGLAAPNGPAFLAGFLALRRAGCVPILLDVAAPEPARAAVVAALGGAGVLATGQAWAAGAGEWSYLPAPAAASRRLAPELGAVKLTSGSTGAPRGIAVRAEALAADDDQLTAVMGLSADDRMVAAVPLSHSYGFASLALPALRRGALLLVAEERSPLAPLLAARTGEATFFPTVPAFLGAFSRLAEPPPLPATLRLVVSAGAPLAPETATSFRERTGLPVHVFYGASECGGIAYDRVGGAAERGSVGEAIPHVALELDAESGRLAVRSAAVADGYLPERSREDGSDTGTDLGGGRFLTGDLAAFSGRELRLLGRADDLILVKGKKVNPREVEGVLRGLAGVTDVAVVGVPAPGAAGDQVRAVVACPGGELAYEAVAAYCRSHLPEHKVPRSLVLVRDLPRTDRGKLDRAALLALSGPS